MSVQARVVAERYRLDRLVGSGGMGQVWQARDLRLQRDVAVKTVDLTASTQPLAAERFRREIVATAGLTHPNIVTVYDAGTEDGTAFLVMELLRGRTLLDLVRKLGPLSFAEGLPIAEQVASALAAAHQIGVVHRDIKPANIMITDGTAKVLDFGIARLTDDSGITLTQPATALGTAAYMAPEQASGSPVSAASDVYALGCLLMMMFTGKPPFIGDSGVAIAAQQLTATPPRLRTLRTDTPPALDALVDRMLAKEPQQRPSDRDVISELRRIMADPSALPTAPTQVLPPVPSSPVTPLTAGLGDAAGSSLASSSREPERRTSVMPVVDPRAPRPATAAASPPEHPRRRRWPWVVAVVLAAALALSAVYLIQRTPARTPTPTPTATVTRQVTQTSRVTTTPTLTATAPATTAQTTTQQPTRTATSTPPASPSTTAPRVTGSPSTAASTGPRTRPTETSQTG